MISLLSVDGYAYTKIHILEYEIDPIPLDGEATGRSEAPGFEMIRDPQGLIRNLYLTVASTDSENPDFLHLYGVCKSMGTIPFVTVVFRDLDGEIISQDVYIRLQRLKAKRFERYGKIYVGSMKLSFIAKKGKL